jgi:hypothetical protein
MWLFTRYGFFSTVCARQGEGHPGQPADSDRVMIRARMESHLEALQTRFPDQFAGIRIVEMPETDYRYRVFVDKAVWTEVLMGLSEELDYDNFKSAVGICWD